MNATSHSLLLSFESSYACQKWHILRQFDALQKKARYDFYREIWQCDNFFILKWLSFHRTNVAVSCLQCIELANLLKIFYNTASEIVGMAYKGKKKQKRFIHCCLDNKRVGKL